MKGPYTTTKRVERLTVVTSELREGDVVLAHGLRCLLDGPVLVSQSHPTSPVGDGLTRYVRALVLNRDDVPHEVVPLGWTREQDGSHRWTIQGNDFARWAIERPSAVAEVVSPTGDSPAKQPEWGILRAGAIEAHDDYGSAEYAAALANDEDYGSTSVVRFYDPDGSGARWVVWHSETGEWSPVEGI